MTQIVKLGKIHSKYQDWASSLMTRLGPKVNVNNEAEFILKKQIHSLILSDDSSYSILHGMSKWSGRGKLIYGDEYNKIECLRGNDLLNYYRSKAFINLELGPAFWSFLYEPATLGNGTAIPQYESVIVINVDAVKRLARDLTTCLPEIPRNNIENLVFNVVGLHEYGHQYMFGNFLPDQMISNRDVIDLNLAEGFASIFAHGMSTTYERYILAECCLYQPLPYRFYHALRPYSLAGLFRYLVGNADYQSGLQEFIGITCVRIKFSSGSITSETVIQGAPLMDSSDAGGVVIAGEKIERLVPLPSGYIITPLIENMLGRCPRTTRIFAHEITNHNDYGIFPANVTIIPINKLDLKELIGKHFKEEPEIRLKNILASIASAGFKIC